MCSEQWCSWGLVKPEPHHQLYILRTILRTPTANTYIHKLDSLQNSRSVLPPLLSASEFPILISCAFRGCWALVMGRNLQG